MTPEEKKARAEELKHEPHDKKFQRLAIPRVNKAIKAIRQLGSLANRSAYAYTDEQVVKLLDAIKKATADVQARFQGNKDNGTTFSF
jgi:transcription elongation GreA/GreB family factor